MISVYVYKYYRTNLRSLFYDEVTPQSQTFLRDDFGRLVFFMQLKDRAWLDFGV